MHRRIRLNVRLRTLAAAVLVAGAAACTEDLDGGAGCPVLCPQPNVNVRDTILFPVLLDSTVSGEFPPLGEERFLVLADRGDTLQTRVIIRFDTLFNSFRLDTATQDSAVTRVDSAYLYMRLQVPDTLIAPVTVEAYDIDSLATEEAPPDTVAAALEARFVPSRFLGSVTLNPGDSLRDSVKVPINRDTLLSRVLSGTRLRIGLRAVSDSGIQLNFISSESGTVPFLRYWVSPDTSVDPLSVGAESKLPVSPGWLASALRDFVIVPVGSPPRPADALEVGGYSPRRSYLRFDIPSYFTDSASVVRATLLLTQRPNYTSAARADSLVIVAVPIIAGSAVTDVPTLLQLMAARPVDSTRVAPVDSGVRAFDLVQLVRQWGLTKPEVMPRSLGLGSVTEGQGLGLVQFYSTEADPLLRPRLRLTYVPRLDFTLP